MRPAWWEWGVQEPIPIFNMHILPSALENRNYISPGELRFSDSAASAAAPRCLYQRILYDCQARKVPSSPRSPATDLSTTAQDGKATSNSVPAGAKPGGCTGRTVSARLGQSFLQSATGEPTTSIQLGQRLRAQRAPGSFRAGILT